MRRRPLSQVLLRNVVQACLTCEEAALIYLRFMAFAAMLCLTGCAAASRSTASPSLPQDRGYESKIAAATTYEEFIANTAKAANISWTIQDDQKIAYVFGAGSAHYISVGVRVSMTPGGQMTETSQARLLALKDRLETLWRAAQDRNTLQSLSLYPIAPPQFIAGFAPGQLPHGRTGMTPPFVPNLTERIKWQARVDDFRALTGETQISAPTDAIPEGALIVLSGTRWVGSAPRFKTPSQGADDIDAALDTLFQQGVL